MTDRLQQDFWEFHQANPQVFEEFVGLARAMKRTGRRHYSADSIMHKIRFETDLKTTGGDGFKVNNNHVAYYSRLAMDRYPELRGFFHIRKDIDLSQAEPGGTLNLTPTVAQAPASPGLLFDLPVYPTAANYGGATR